MKEYRPSFLKINFFLLISAFLWAFYVTSWITEDAFISFRVIDNLINGHGPRWNIDERVQVFTHPLWMFLLLPITMLFGDPYWAAIGLSAACLLFFLAVALRILDGINFFSLVILLCFLSSRAFIDFSSSGLENPLTHVLLAVFFLAWKFNKKNYFILFLLFSFLYLNRPDSVIFAAAPLIYLIHSDFCTQKKFELRHNLCLAALGLIPMVCWLLFSFIYYGAFFPNTAIAKVQNGLSILESAKQTWGLINYSIRNDPGTVAFIAIGVCFGFFDRKYLSFSFGILLYFIYLFYVGGDYMAGRFLTAPLVVSLLIIGSTIPRIIASNRNYKYYALVLALVFLATKAEAHFFLKNYDGSYIDENGIADERSFYYQNLGVRPTLLHGTWLRHDFLREGMNLRRQNEKYFIKCNIGMTPYAAGAKYVFIDPLALSDGFIARLPAAVGGRVGHYERSLPAGYLESRISYKNMMDDPALRRLWDDTHIVFRGEIFTKERFLALFRLNFRKELYSLKIKDRSNIIFNGAVYKKTKNTCLGQKADVTIDASKMQIIKKQTYSFKEPSPTQRPPEFE